MVPGGVQCFNIIPKRSAHQQRNEWKNKRNEGIRAPLIHLTANESNILCKTENKLHTL